MPEKSDLETLRDMGVSALIYDSDSAGKNDLEGLRQIIDKLEPKKHRASTGGAVLPGRDQSAHQHEADFDDPDEDEDWE